MFVNWLLLTTMTSKGVRVKRELKVTYAIKVES